VRRVIGQGSFGFVQHGIWDVYPLHASTLPRTKREVAIKSVPRYDYTGDRTVSSVRTEIEVMIVHRRCPFIIPLIAVVQEPEQTHLVMQFCPGGDLFGLLAKARAQHETALSSPFFRDQMMFWLREIVAALHYLHTNDIFHGDFKCENILIDSGDHVRLCDFGLSRVGLKSELFSPRVKGSEFTVSPEQTRKERYGVASDVWALGYVMLFMFTDLSPVKHEDNSTENANVPLLATQINLDPGVAALIKRLLTVDKARRPTIQEVMTDALFDGVDWTAVYNKTAPQPTPPPRPLLAAALPAATVCGDDNFEPVFTCLPPRPIEYERCRVLTIL
jgi:serum/glucocorticoid-regulated kinase 2